MQKSKKAILIFILMLSFNMIFIDIVKAETYNNISDSLVSCGTIKNIPAILPKVISIIYIIVQIVIPVLLVVFGMIDLLKGVMGQKEDEIKKGQQTLIKRIITAVLVFFVFAIVKLVVSLAADNQSQSNGMIDCAECFIKNKCNSSLEEPKHE